MLDIDEVLLAKSKDELIDLSYQTNPIGMLWTPFLPNGMNYYQSKNPLKDCFYSPITAYSPVRKVAIPRQLIGKCLVMPGNHGLKESTSPNKLINDSLSDIRIAHFPVRSSEQVVVKTITALATIRMKKNRLQGEATHLVPIMRLIKETNFYLKAEVLHKLAENYGNQEIELNSIKADVKNLMRGLFGANRRVNLLPDIDMKYTNLAKVNELKLLSELIQEQSARLAKSLGLLDDYIYNLEGE